MPLRTAPAGQPVQPPPYSASGVAASPDAKPDAPPSYDSLQINVSDAATVHMHIGGGSDIVIRGADNNGLAIGGATNDTPLPNNPPPYSPNREETEV